MSNKTLFILMGLLLAWFWGMVLWAVVAWARPSGKYDCSMASFHPDMPIEVKRKCREVNT